MKGLNFNCFFRLKFSHDNQYLTENEKALTYTVRKKHSHALLYITLFILYFSPFLSKLSPESFVIIKKFYVRWRDDYDCFSISVSKL